MKPIKFKGCNCTYAEHQPQYLPLPVYKTDEGMVTSCWQPSFRERLSILFKGKIFVDMATFNQPLQPLKLMTINPAEDAE